MNAGGVVFLTADHGNAEKMKNPDGSPFTAHTTNVVPFRGHRRGRREAARGRLPGGHRPDDAAPISVCPSLEEMTSKGHYCGVTSLFEKRLGEKL